MKTLIISPSPNFYGSEQVLYDYLEGTGQSIDVAVNENGIFKVKLLALPGRIRISGFDGKRLKPFYLQLFWQLLKGKYEKVYWNEGGHINYCLLLSKVFRGKQFIVHIRITEDTIIERWSYKPPSNVSFLTISSYMQSAFSYPSKLIYDPFPFGGELKTGAAIRDIDPINIGLIGRVTFSKGVSLLADILKKIRLNGLQEKYRFKLYGTISDDAKGTAWLKELMEDEMVQFPGFCDDKDKMYSSIDSVLHLNGQEPLGRIFPETINAGLPFIGINSGGIGELGELTGLREFLVDPKSDRIVEDIFNKLEEVRNNYSYFTDKVNASLPRFKELFSVTNYISQLDKILD